MNYVDRATENLTSAEKNNFFRIYEKERKSEKWAYFWWVLLGFIGGHRFYLGRYGTGLIILFITVFTCGLGALIGWYDIVNVRRMTEEENSEKILDIVKVVKRK
ncbi:TM2 domain-containing protein [Bacillus amyloliquefaciens]|uniref:TM2 domain-containing protein n=1 Tax=Bacillus amyloliquefaciens TaxID=1390 RepID=UPI0005ED8D10|nr:TM2 domain-containing protein [Bacillus amyloliquefaciens]